MVVTCADGVFQRREPRPGPQRARREHVGADVQVPAFAHPKRQTRDAVVESRRRDVERVGVDERVWRRDDVGQRLGREAGAGAEPRPHQAVVMALDDREREGIARGQVPGIARELAANVVDQPRRPAERQLAIPRQRQPQQLIEPHEMVHVGVRDAHVREAQAVPRAQAVDAAEIEEERVALPAQCDVQCRVLKRPVHEHRPKARLHGAVSYRTRRDGANRAAARAQFNPPRRAVGLSGGSCVDASFSRLTATTRRRRGLRSRERARARACGC